MNRVVNGYEFLEQVGAGGFGIVYRARQAAIERDVAIKVILPQYAEQPAFVERFDQEARLIARLEHPHIVPLYDYWQDAEGAFLVMRWLPQTLRSRIQTAGGLPLADAANLLDQIAGALHSAHRSGVIHRDIKPDNLLLDAEGNAYLADFGIAKVIDGGTITAHGQIIGSMAYLAPEQIAGNAVTPQSDIYSLGLVLYELLTGVQPFAGASVSELVYHHLNDPIPSLQTCQPELPRALDAVLALATAKQPADRYPDVIRFAHALRAALPVVQRLQPLADPLTERELEILQLLANGLSNGEIAEHLFVTLGTVKWYKKQIYSKLDVHSRAQAVDHARALQLIAPERDTPPEAKPAPPDLELMAAPTALTAVPMSPPLRLPTQTTPFVGRETEISRLIALIRDPQNRLVTVLAPGGMGKTRLALEIAAAAANLFPEGATFIPLGSVTAPEYVVSAIASAVGVALSGQLDPRIQLLEHFRRRRMLLILDNFEHLLEAAPLLVDILEAAPQLQILTTSRERLNLSAELVFPLGGMDIPEENSRADLLASGAVRLFVGAAQRANAAAQFTAADLEQVARICRLVEGMPLAILLAASWADLLKIDEIAEEVSRGIDFLESQWRDTPERQRSIRAVFDSSWRRLNANEAAVLAKLSVFRGGFTRRAAEQVAGASLRALSGLVNKALLWMDAEGRCSIHELLRQYAAEQLETAALGDSVQAAHSAYYLEALTAHESDLTGPNQIVTLNDIEADIDNVRAAVTWASAQRDYARLAAAVHPLWLYYRYGGAYADGSDLFEALATALRGVAPAPLRDALLGDVLAHQARLLIEMHERARADQLLAEAAPLIEASGQTRLRAFFQLAQGAWLPWEEVEGKVEASRAALELYTSIDDEWGKASASWQVAMVLRFGTGQADDEVRELFSYSYAINEAIGDSFAQARVLNAFAFLIEGDDRYRQRIALLEQVLAMRRTQKSRAMVALALGNLGLYRAAAGRLTEAARDHEEQLAIKREQGNVHDVLGFDDLGEVYLRQGRLADARPLFDEALSRLANTEQYAWRNIYRLYLMELAYIEGDYLRAESIAGELVRENMGASTLQRHHRLTFSLAVAGLAALARGDTASARGWHELSVDSAKTDPDQNGANFAQIVLAKIALAEGDAQTALNLFEVAIAYLKTAYVYDLSLGWEHDLCLALALTACSRAALKLDQSERATAYCRAALQHAEPLHVDAFALMALIPAAEIALANGDRQQATLLASLAAQHPHTFAFDRAEAARLLAALPHEAAALTETPHDLWIAVEELIET